MGPNVAIWLKAPDCPPSQDELLEIARRLDPGAVSSVEFGICDTEPHGGSTRSAEEPRPFGMNLGGTGFSAEELQPAASALGFFPSAALHAFAYANAAVDHRMLAELALYLARRFDGVIDFGGSLGDVPATRGMLLEVPYRVDERIAAEKSATYHLGDVEFLESWLRAPGFHMLR